MTPTPGMCALDDGPGLLRSWCEGLARASRALLTALAVSRPSGCRPSLPRREKPAGKRAG